MSILTKTVNLPVFIEIAPDLMANVGSIIHRANLHFERILILTGPSATGELARIAADSLTEFGYEVRTRVVRNNTHSEAKKVMEAMDVSMPDLVMSIGGGRVIDVGKFATHERLVNFIAVPTSASNDGVASPIAVIQFGNRVKSNLCHMPIGVIADLSVISHAPRDLLRAGVGDLIGNLSASRDYELSCRKKGTRLDNFARIISMQSANTVLHAEPRDFGDTGFMSVLVDGLVMSGIAMGIAGNSLPASGAEHMISHSLDKMFPRKNIHGLQVALALPYTFGLRGEDPSFLLDFYRDIGLPMHPSDLKISREQFIDAAVGAIHTRPGRYTILNEIMDRKDHEAAYDRAFGKGDRSPLHPAMR
jgi:glycerol-1-phosphate dehydrogenase [NAD(P)+]